MTCAYCGHENPIPKSEVSIDEVDFDDALNHLAQTEPSEDTLTTQCQTCAAVFQFEANIHAGECPFCGSSIVTSNSYHKHIKPHALLPFKIAAREAKQAFRQWIKGRWFAPGGLKKYARADTQLHGMYVPYWTYDSATDTTYSGQRGDVYQVPQTYQVIENGRQVTRTRMVTKIRWSPVSGRVLRRFDDVLVLASNSLPRQVTQRLEPWDLASLVPYQEAYLSGYRSEVYQIDLEPGFEHARQVMDRIIRSDVNQDIGGDQQRIQRLDTQHHDISFKHILLPVWLATFRYRNKPYRFVINARTGEVQGERPYSAWKIAFAVLVGTALAGAAVYLYSQGAAMQGTY